MTLGMKCGNRGFKQEYNMKHYVQLHTLWYTVQLTKKNNTWDKQNGFNQVSDSSQEKSMIYIKGDRLFAFTKPCGWMPPVLFP